ncbi:MAG: hypothetical protein ACRETB_06460 [Steroidobacteraceae bacterium]
MRWTVLLGLAGLALGLGPPLAAGEPTRAAQALIARCAQQASVATRGIDALRAACPGIDHAVEALNLDAFLPAHWRSDASAQALADLSVLASRYARPAPALRLDVAQLQRIALGLALPPAPRSWWQRIGAWIKAHIGRWLAPTSSGKRGWLRLLSYLIPGPRLARILLATLMGLIVLATAAAVVLEWRMGGLFDRRRRPRHLTRRLSATANPDGTEPAADTPLDLAFLDAAGQRERPVLLLRMLVRALAASHRIGRERNLSFRELIARARFDSDRQRADFGRFALQAERALYGGAQFDATTPESAPGDARALHAALLHPPAGPGLAAAAQPRFSAAGPSAAARARGAGQSTSDEHPRA